MVGKVTLWHVYLKAYQYRFNIVSTAASNLVRLSFSLEQMMAGESACKASKASVKDFSLVVTCAFLALSELTSCLWSMTAWNFPLHRQWNVSEARDSWMNKRLTCKSPTWAPASRSSDESQHEQQLCNQQLTSASPPPHPHAWWEEKTAVLLTTHCI